MSQQQQTCKLHDRLNRDDCGTVVEFGFDEAGRGCFFGPIMAGAVLWPLEETWTDEVRALAGKIRDSKKLTPKRRSEYAERIRTLIGVWGVGSVSAAEINEEGIQWANREAFRRALAEAWQKYIAVNPGDCRGVRFVVDGTISFKDLGESVVPGRECQEEMVVEGDGKYLSVAAASILAKVAHDDWIGGWMAANGELAERYDMVGSKGYGTAKHRAGLGKWGAVEGHRTLFVRNWVPGAGSGGGAEKSRKPQAKFAAKVKPDEEGKCLIKIGQ